MWGEEEEGGLCTTSVPEGLNECIKINTDGTGAAFAKVTGFSRAGRKIFWAPGVLKGEKKKRVGKEINK